MSRTSTPNVTPSYHMPVQVPNVVPDRVAAAPVKSPDDIAASTRDKAPVEALVVTPPTYESAKTSVIAPPVALVPLAHSQDKDTPAPMTQVPPRVLAKAPPTLYQCSYECTNQCLYIEPTTEPRAAAANLPSRGPTNKSTFVPSVAPITVPITVPVITVPTKASGHGPTNAPATATTTAPTNELAEAPRSVLCVKRCVLVDLGTGVERKLRQLRDTTYDPSLAGTSGYSIRCDVGSPVTNISFAFNGGIHHDTVFPYWMNGNMSGGQTILRVFYLASCGGKQVTIWANDSSSQQECFRESFQLTATCSSPVAHRAMRKQ